MVRGGWRSRPIQDRERSWLDSFDFVDWAEHDVTVKSCLEIRMSVRGNKYFNLPEAVEFALAQPNVDTFVIDSWALWKDEEAQDHVRRLFSQSQDRDWKVHVSLIGADYTGSNEGLDILGLFLPVRYLVLDAIDDQTIQLLNSFPNLVELDISRVRLYHTQLMSLFENDNLVKKTPHVNIGLTQHDRAPVRFPAAAKNRWRSLQCSLHGYSAIWFHDLSRQITQLDALQYFDLILDNLHDHDDYSEAIRTLSAWIASPSCGLSHLGIVGVHQYELSLSSSLTLVQGIGQNRSIRELAIGGLSGDLNWSTDVLPEIAKSSVHHLMIEGKTTLDQNMLRKWILQMRPTRLISIKQDPYHSDAYKIVRYESLLHIRWKEIWQTIHQSGQTTELPNCSFLTTLPPGCWAQALQRFDVAHYIQEPRISYSDTILEMTFFLLRHWLTSISVVPCKRPVVSDDEDQYWSFFIATASNADAVQVRPGLVIQA